MAATINKPLKITVVGDGAVGKTCLLVVYTSNSFPEEYVPTVFDNYAGEHEVDGRKYAVTLWDTAGQEEYERLRPLSYPDTKVFLICFSLENRVSFDNVASKWLPEIRSNCSKTPIVLVGTKKDIRNLETLKPKDGQRLCRKHGLASYIECSAKTQEAVQDVFTQAVLAATGATKKTSFCTML